MAAAIARRDVSRSYFLLFSLDHIAKSDFFKQCDEQRPACSNCIKHSTRCSFLKQFHSGQPSPSPAAAPPVQFHPQVSPPRTQSPALAERNGATGSLLALSEPILHPVATHSSLNVVDLELLHNYDTSTAYTLESIPALQTFLRLTVPRMAFSHPFLLHAILAISALHLAHFKRDLRAHYLSQANYHYHAALPTVTSLLSATINEDTCRALYIFSTLSSIFTLGMGPKPGDFLVFDEEGAADWLIRFRGVRALMESQPGVLQHSELSPLFSISARQMDQPAPKNQHLQSLRQLIIERASNLPDVHVFIAALDDLAQSFPDSYTLGLRSTQTSLQIVFVWLYRLSDDFVQHLQKRNAVALVVLAHFCVLLNSLSSIWWIKGWVEHLLAAIYAELDAEHRMWINWPMEEIGWIPGS